MDSTELLENKIGPLAKTYDLFREGTIRESVELMNERRTAKGNLKKELRDNWFYTANIGACEHNEDGTLTYYITNKIGFNKIAASNIGEFCKQLLEKQNYHLSNEQRNELHKLAEQGHAVKVNPADLRLNFESIFGGWISPLDIVYQFFHHTRKVNDTLCFIEINTKDYSNSTHSERVLAEIVYGKGNEFVENMKMLAKAGKRTTRIYVPNPKYIKTHVKKGSAVGFACMLGDFGHILSYLGIFDANSAFLADVVKVDDPEIAIRGELKGRKIVTFKK